MLKSSRSLQTSLLALRGWAPLVIASVVLGFFNNASAANVRIDILDETPFHSFPPGEQFSFTILASVATGSTPRLLNYQWQDFRGRSLGPIVNFSTGARTTVVSPVAIPSTGYYGLVFRADDESVVFAATVGKHREIGFVVLPTKSALERSLDLDSPFGVVHANLDDPQLSTWVKTLTWNTIGADAWKAEIARRRERGLQELPLVFGDRWTTNDNSPVSDTFLKTLTDRIQPYFEADANIDHWELGIEENLRRQFAAPAYFANLRAKVAAVREVADALNPQMRFLYQIAETRVSDAEKFFASEAAAAFDILALHPYAWPDFPTPERWFDTYMDDLDHAMRKHSVKFPIWFTEIGAPQNDARVAQMYSGRNPVRGQSRAENSAYLVKAHVLALARGIERIFWYNYRDRDAKTRDVEAHFGLIDYWGFPKPSYAAYTTMTSCLQDTVFDGRRDLSAGIRVYEFKGAKKKCLVAWTYPASKQPISRSALYSGSNKDDVIAVTNTVGTPLPNSENIIIDEYPVFISAHEVSEVTSD